MKAFNIFYTTNKGEFKNETIYSHDAYSAACFLIEEKKYNCNPLKNIMVR